MSNKSYSGQQLADLVKVEGITFRRYIRSDGTRVGRGKKYAFDAEDAQLLIQGFLTGKKGTVEVTDEETGETKTEKVDKLSEEQASRIAKHLIDEDLASEPDTEEEDTDTEDTEEDTDTEPASEGDDLTDLEDIEDPDSSLEPDGNN